MLHLSSRLPQLKSFLYCFPLEVGAFTIGWLMCVGEIVRYLLLPLHLAYVYITDESLGNFAEILTLSFMNVSIVEPIASVIFLIGLYKNKIIYLLPALILYVGKIINFFLYGLLLLFTHRRFFFLEYMFGFEREFTNYRIQNIIIDGVFYVITGALMVYSFLIVNSYFNVLRRGRGITILEDEEA